MTATFLLKLPEGVKQVVVKVEELDETTKKFLRKLHNASREISRIPSRLSDERLQAALKVEVLHDDDEQSAF